MLEKDIMRHIEAMNFGCKAHAGQMYGDCPYVRHLAHVESVMQRFGIADPDLLSAAWLHDSIEDAHVEFVELSIRFGMEIANLVFAVTDGEGKNRRERKMASYDKIANFPRAVILKLADRIANMESSLVKNSGLFQMYVKEHPVFREKLRGLSVNGSETRVSAMWSYLDGLTRLRTRARNGNRSRVITRGLCPIKTQMPDTAI